MIFYCSQKIDFDSRQFSFILGLEYASKAVALDSTNSDAHKWFAILTGMQTDFLPIKEKIQTANVFQEHLLLALKNKESDYSLHYLLARFKYEVINELYF